MDKSKIIPIARKHLTYLLVSLAFCSFVKSRPSTFILLNDKTVNSGIDFIHFAPRPRWCEIGPSVVGAATNEGLDLVFKEEGEFWKSNGRLLSMDEFANMHLIKMNPSTGLKVVNVDAIGTDPAMSGLVLDAIQMRTPTSS